MLGTERFNQLHIHGLVAAVGQDAKMGRPLVQSLGSFMESGHDVHGSTGSNDWGSGGVISFHVRHDGNL